MDVLFRCGEECHQFLRLNQKEAELRIAIDSRKIDVALADSNPQYDNRDADPRTRRLEASGEERRQPPDELRLAR